MVNGNKIINLMNGNAVCVLKILHQASPLTEGLCLCGYNWDFQQDNVIQAAERTKEFVLNHKVALFLTILHALMTRIQLRISGDG